jgi:hypothetical protein
MRARHARCAAARHASFEGLRAGRDAQCVGRRQGAAETAPVGRFRGGRLPQASMAACHDDSVTVDRDSARQAFIRRRLERGTTGKVQPAPVLRQAARAKATASGPAGKRSCSEASLAARQTASATSIGRVTADSCANPANTLCA